MAIKFQIRRDISNNWSDSNPTLAEGEFGFETNTNKLKIGTGSNTWNTLSYIAGGNSFIGAEVIFNSNVSNNAAISATKLSFTQNGSNAIIRTIDAKLKDGRASTADFTVIPRPTTPDGWYNDYTNSDGAGSWQVTANIPNSIQMSGGGNVQGVGLLFDFRTSAQTPNPGLAETNMIRMYSNVKSDAGPAVHIHQILGLAEFSCNVASSSVENEGAIILGTTRALGPSANGSARSKGIWGGDFHVEKYANVAYGSMVGLEVGVHTAVTQPTTGANNRQNGVEIWSGNRSGVTTSVAAHNALDIFGDGGWNNFIRCRHTDNTTEVFKLAKDGRIDVLSPLDNAILTVSVNQNNKQALFQLSGRNNSASAINAVMVCDPTQNDNEVRAGSTTNHSFNLISNNSTKIKVKSSGSIQFIPLSAPPVLGNTNGDVYFDSTMQKLRVYANNAWANINL